MYMDILAFGAMLLIVVLLAQWVYQFTSGNQE